MDKKGVCIMLIVILSAWGSYQLVVSAKDGVISALHEGAENSRQERIKEMAEAILMADKMRGE